MERFKALFSKSFRAEALDELYHNLEKLNNELNDEIFIILNDHKSRTSMANVYEGNEIRQQMATTSTHPDLTDTSNESSLFKMIAVIAEMVQHVESKLIESQTTYDQILLMFGSNDLTPFNLTRNDKSEITINVGLFDTSLICVMLMIYLFNDSMTFIKSISTAISFFAYSNNIIDGSELNPDIKNNTIDEVADNVQTMLNKIFKPLHNIIHVLNKSYTSDNIKAQYFVNSVYQLLKGLIILNKLECDNEYLNLSLFNTAEELKCSILHSGVIPALSVIKVCSIYGFNCRYDWFDNDRFDQFIARYGKGVKSLSLFVMDKSNYSTLYALSSVYSIRFANASYSNKLFTDIDKIKSEEISFQLLNSTNRAMTFTTPDIEYKNKLCFYVLEVQDRIFYVSNEINSLDESMDSMLINGQIMNDNRNVINSYIIYNVMNHEPNNVETIVYDIDDVKQILNDLKAGKKITHNEPKPSAVSITPDIKLMETKISNQALVLKIIAFVFIVAIIVFIAYSPKRPDVKHEQTIYDRSLY